MYDNSNAVIINNRLKVDNIINKLLIIEVELPQSIYLFKVIIPKYAINSSSCYVIHRNRKIFDNRDKEYYYEKIKNR